jgi:hypothetical protein
MLLGASPLPEHIPHPVGGVPVHEINVNLLSKFDADESPYYYADALANVGRMFFCPLPCRFRPVFDLLRDIPTRIHIIDRVIFAIQIPVQGQWAIQVAQPLVRARPPAYCRLIVARTDVEQPRIAVVAVAPCPRKAIRVGTAAPLRHQVTEGFGCQRAGYRLNAVHRRPDVPQLSYHRHAPVDKWCRLPCTISDVWRHISQAPMSPL